MNKDEITIKIKKDIKKKNIANSLLKNETIRSYFFTERYPKYRKKMIREFYLKQIIQFFIFISASLYLYHIDYSFFSFILAALSFYKIYSITKREYKNNHKPFKLEHNDYIVISQNFDEEFLNDFMFAYDKEDQNLEYITKQSDYKKIENIYKDLYVKDLFKK